MRIPAFVLMAASCCLAGNSYAYCVSNNTDRDAQFSSFGGPIFSKTVKPGGKECCPYNEKSCNRGATKTSLVQMATSVGTGSTNVWTASTTSGYRCGAEMGKGTQVLSENYLGSASCITPGGRALSWLGVYCDRINGVRLD